MNEKQCINCGNSLPLEAVFCGNCGTKQTTEAPVNEVQAQPSAPQPAPQAQPTPQAPKAQPAPQAPQAQPAPQAPQAPQAAPQQYAPQYAPQPYIPRVPMNPICSAFFFALAALALSLPVLFQFIFFAEAEFFDFGSIWAPLQLGIALAGITIASKTDPEKYSIVKPSKIMCIIAGGFALMFILFSSFVLLGQL